MRKAIHKSIHNSTAKICEDFAEPPCDLELREPDPTRRVVRLVVTAAAGALLVAAILVLAIRIPKIQLEKDVHQFTSTTNEVEQFLRDAVNYTRRINCPCQTQTFSLCNVTTFRIYYEHKLTSTGYNISGLHLWNDEGALFVDALCKAKSNIHTISESICKHILSTVINIEDMRTIITTASAFIGPELLYKEIGLRIDSNVYEQAALYSGLLDFINETTEGVKYSVGLINLLRSMRYQFYINSSSSEEDYRKASEPTRKEFDMSFCFGMHVNWTRYLEICKPAFCDVEWEYEVTVLSRGMRAAGQVGGITTIITLALKLLIWPSIRAAFRFPTSSKSPSTAND